MLRHSTPHFPPNPVGAQRHKRAPVNATGCVSDSHSKKINIEYFYFPRSGIKDKRDVEFRHSMIPEIDGKWRAKMS